MGWEYGQLAAQIYDLDKPIGHSFGDVEYYRDRLAGIEGRVLEPAVGTGRILVPLLEAGLTVDGTDASPDMLEVCRRHCRERGLDPVLREADMADPVDEAAYAAVIVPAGSINLLDRDTATRALGRFRDGLRPGGRLILDLLPTQLVTEPPSLWPLRHWRSGDHMWTLQTMHLEHDAVANRTTQWLRYEKWHDGGLVATELQLLGLQVWGLAEFGGLLAEVGFSDITATADYGDQPPTADSRSWQLDARRW